MAGTVVIACKAPNGIRLNLHTFEVIGNKDHGNVRLVRGKEVTLKGWSHAWGTPDLTTESGGYALTEIDADFWEAWLVRNNSSPLLADKTILVPTAKGGMNEATAKARDHRDVPQMFAPARENDPRMPDSAKLQTADEMRGRAAA